MRILLLNYNVAFVGGGSFYRSWHWGRRLADRGHAVTVLATAPAGSVRVRVRQQAGVSLVQMPGLLPRRWRYGYDPYEVLRRLAWVGRRQFDIVHALDCRPVVVYPALLAQRRGARLVMDWLDWFGRGGSVEQRPNWLLRTVLRPIETYYEEAFRRRADATIVINSALEARARGLGVQPQRMVRLVYGADPDSLRPLDKAEARASLGLPGHVPLVGYVGTLFADDAALLEAALARVRAEMPSAELMLVGNTKSPRPAGEGVRRTGFVSYAALNEYLAACDVLCLPLADSVANRGRWPSKMMDYFAVGRPTAACDVGDVGAVLREAQAGLAGAPTGPALAEQILALLRNSAQAAVLGRNARRAAETTYNWDTLTTRLEALYEALLNDAPALAPPARATAPAERT